VAEPRGLESKSNLFVGWARGWRNHGGLKSNQTCPPAGPGAQSSTFIVSSTTTIITMVIIHHQSSSISITVIITTVCSATSSSIINRHPSASPSSSPPFVRRPGFQKVSALTIDQTSQAIAAAIKTLNF